MRASIEASRQQIAESLRDIQTSVEESIDWRRQVREHPWQAVGIAVGFGFYLGFR